MAHLSRVTNAPAYQTSGQTVIQRSTYSLAGQAIAVRVASSPLATNNGLFYLYSDHLGSASALVDSGGQKVNETRYLPFGGYRSGGIGHVQRLGQGVLPAGAHSTAKRNRSAATWLVRRAISSGSRPCSAARAAAVWATYAGSLRLPR